MKQTSSVCNPPSLPAFIPSLLLRPTFSFFLLSARAAALISLYGWGRGCIPRAGVHAAKHGPTKKDDVSTSLVTTDVPSLHLEFEDPCISNKAIGGRRSRRASIGSSVKREAARVVTCLESREIPELSGKGGTRRKGAFSFYASVCRLLPGPPDKGTSRYDVRIRGGSGVMEKRT